MSNDMNLGNIPVLSAGQCVDLLSNMYINYINKGISFNTLPSVMLWGAPGIGKSQSIRQIADAIAMKTYKKVNVTDVRLILFNPIDLRGIPTANESKTLAVWLKPKIFQMDPSSNVVNILFLDEISAAPLSVQAAAYQITLDKTVGEHKLPDNCIVIAAGNRTTDKSVAYAMPKALSNRLLHLEVDANIDAWGKWAVQHDIHPMVTGFLKFKPNYLMQFNTNASTLAFATPRTWEMVSNVLKTVSSDLDIVYDLIAGLVGKAITVEFKTWSKIYRNLPNMDDIFNGLRADVPTRGDVCYAVISSMVAYAKLHKDNMRKIENSIAYAMKLPPEYSTILLKDYIYLEDGYMNKLLKIPTFSRWLQTRGKLLDELNGK